MEGFLGLYYRSAAFRGSRQGGRRGPLVLYGDVIRWALTPAAGSGLQDLKSDTNQPDVLNKYEAELEPDPQDEAGAAAGPPEEGECPHTQMDKASFTEHTLGSTPRLSFIWNQSVRPDVSRFPSWTRSTGKTVQWKDGPREHRSTRTLVHGKTGSRENRFTGKPVHRNTGPLEHRSTGTPVHGNTGSREHRFTGTPVHENTGPREHRSTRTTLHGNTGPREEHSSF
ncbi:hypothetical protein EYF80_038920 [Liparis tanakae]|uniref:Uncharacterized protein n=1 Tax=Liparis tanakae TaxID=230148 RepID=A0A4Z2GBC9_9TELE|nr:hypothetical protein EYF80_038920 [Liparis tanakae]